MMIKDVAWVQSAFHKWSNLPRIVMTKFFMEHSGFFGSSSWYSLQGGADGPTTGGHMRWRKLGSHLTARLSFLTASMTFSANWFASKLPPSVFYPPLRLHIAWSSLLKGLRDLSAMFPKLATHGLHRILEREDFQIVQRRRCHKGVWEGSNSW